MTKEGALLTVWVSHLAGHQVLVSSMAGYAPMQQSKGVSIAAGSTRIRRLSPSLLRRSPSEGAPSPIATPQSLQFVKGTDANLAFGTAGQTVPLAKKYFGPTNTMPISKAS
jgi:hypothetical protein